MHPPKAPWALPDGEGAERCLTPKSDAGGDRPSPSTRPTTTRSGASRCTTTGCCSSFSSSRARRRASGSTILKKRENYRKAFAGFDIKKVAAFTDADVERLLQDPGIVRNRMKIASAIKNARGVLEIQKEFGSLDAFLWQFVGGTPKQNAWTSMSQVPAETDESKAMSKALKKRGFNFVGPTICYAFMQAVGMVNDHVVTCFRHAQLHRP